MPLEKEDVPIAMHLSSQGHLILGKTRRRNGRNKKFLFPRGYTNDLFIFEVSEKIAPDRHHRQAGFFSHTCTEYIGESVSILLVQGEPVSAPSALRTGSPDLPDVHPHAGSTDTADNGWYIRSRARSPHSEDMQNPQ